MSKKAYFARPINHYGSDHDNFAIQDIKDIGFEIIDPNEFFTEQEYEKKGMDMFFERINKCDAFFFRGLPNGKITAGVAKEANHAIGINIPVFEIPFGIMDRAMSVEQTREYLRKKDIR